MEIFQVIALLCQLAGDGNSAAINRVQTSCQKYYVECLRKKSDNKGSIRASGINSAYFTDINMAACIEGRNL